MKRMIKSEKYEEVGPILGDVVDVHDIIKITSDKFDVPAGTIVKVIELYQSNPEQIDLEIQCRIVSAPEGSNLIPGEEVFIFCTENDEIGILLSEK